MTRYFFIVAFITACGDAPKHPLGANCANDSECERGVCGGGICIDPFADDDLDGLQNDLELKLGTNPVSADSDNDGVRDKEELDQSLGLLDIDGDGIPDVLESATTDDDNDCIPDQFDANNAVADAELAGLVAVVCKNVGVCANAALSVICDEGAGKRIARCSYDAVADYEADESSCDGRDNDCDGATDEAAPDLDDDDLADCVDDDDDGDGVADAGDVCPAVSDDQADADGDGLGDACDAPLPPVVTATDPVSPASDAMPMLIGDTDPSVAVAVFTGPACDAPLATGTADASGAFAIATPVTTNAETRFYLRATNGAGLTSACIPSAFRYLHDDIAPPAPTFTSIDPPSPSTDASPQVSGNAEAAARVELHASSDCIGQPLGAGSADGDGAFTVSVAVANNTSTTLRAAAIDRAGNRSPCATLTTYVHDGERPAPPSAHPAPFVPASPSSTEANPMLRGCAEAGAQVDIYRQPGCLGDLETTVSADVEDAACATGSGFSGRVAATSNALTTFYGQVRGSAGRISTCVPLGSYLHDDVAPLDPTFTSVNPTSPSSLISPTVVGRAEPGAALTLHADATCGELIGSGAVANDGAFVIVAHVLANRSTPIHALAVDTAGNASRCTFLTSYAHDDSVPVAPTAHPVAVFTPASPSSDDATPILRGCAADGAAVDIFTSDGCTGAPLVTLHASIADALCPTGFAFSGQVTVASPTSETTFRGRTSNASGALSACTTLGTYDLDGDAPAAPVLTAFSPPSPAAMTTPAVTGTAEADVTVSLYRGTGCVGAPIGTATSNGTWTIIGSLDGLNTGTRFWVDATDRGGNASPCASLGTWVHDDLAPADPVMTAAQIAAIPKPTNTSPILHLCSDPGTNVAVYLGPNCAGAAIAATATAATTCGARTDYQVNLSLAAPATVFARATDAAGNRGDCTSLIAIDYDATPPDAPQIARVRATTWTLANASTLDRVTLAIVGKTEPGATVAFTIDGVANGSALADATGRFSGLATNVAANTAGERRLQARATDLAGNVSPPTAERAVVGAFTLTTTDSAAPAANVSTTLHFPDGTQFVGSTTNALGAFTHRIVAGMMVSVAYTRVEGRTERNIDTWMDLMPGDALPIDLTPPAPNVTSDIWSTVQVTLPQQAIAADHFIVQTSCGFEEEVMTQQATVLINIPDTCARTGERIDVLATALRTDSASMFNGSEVVGYATQLGLLVQPQTTTVNLATWRTESNGTLTHTDLTVVNDTTSPVTGILQSMHVRGARVDEFKISELSRDGVALYILPNQTDTLRIPFIGELGRWRNMFGLLTFLPAENGLLATSYKVSQGLSPAPASFDTVHVGTDLLPVVQPDYSVQEGPDLNRPIYGWYLGGSLDETDVASVSFEGEHNCSGQCEQTGSACTDDSQCMQSRCNLFNCDELRWRMVWRPWDPDTRLQVPVVPSGLTPAASWSPAAQRDFSLRTIGWIDFDFVSSWAQAKALGRGLFAFGDDAIESILPDIATVRLSFISDN